MKQSIQALVGARAGGRAGAALCAAVALAVTAPAAAAVAPVATLAGSARLAEPAAGGDGVERAARFRVTLGLATDEPGAELFTVQKAVILFPDRAGTNGRLFPSCSAAQIARLRGAIRRCPAGSQLGGGTLTAQAIQLALTVPARVALFNGPGGRSITFNIQTMRPVTINESIDAPLTRQPGAYGERLELVVPYSLQEIIPGVFVGLQRFDVTIGGTVAVRGVEHSFLRARVCPRQAMRGSFEVANHTTGQRATATAAGRVRCTAG